MGGWARCAQAWQAVETSVGGRMRSRTSPNDAGATTPPDPTPQSGFAAFALANPLFVVEDSGLDHLHE